MHSTEALTWHGASSNNPFAQAPSPVPTPGPTYAYSSPPPSASATPALVQGHAHPQVPPSRRTRPRFPHVPLSHLVRTRWPPFLARVPGRAASTRSGTSGRSATGVLRLVMLRGSALARLRLCSHKISCILCLYATTTYDPRFAPSLCIMP
jgi:hypothetical protein